MRQDEKWPIWMLALVLYPFVAAAVAINLFMLALMGQVAGLPSLTPDLALLIAFPVGIPTAIAAGRWLRGLMDEAD